MESRIKRIFISIVFMLEATSHWSVLSVLWLFFVSITMTMLMASSSSRQAGRQHNITVVELRCTKLVYISIHTYRYIIQLYITHNIYT